MIEKGERCHCRKEIIAEISICRKNKLTFPEECTMIKTEREHLFVWRVI